MIRTITEAFALAPMHNPPQPGETLREDVLPELGLTVSEAARQLGVSRVQLSRVLHGRAPISPDLALRLEQRLTGPTAEVWVSLFRSSRCGETRNRRTDRMPVS